MTTARSKWSRGTTEKYKIELLLTAAGYPGVTIKYEHAERKFIVRSPEGLYFGAFFSLAKARGMALSILQENRPDLLEGGGKGKLSRLRPRPGVYEAIEDFLAGRTKEIEAPEEKRGG